MKCCPNCGKEVFNKDGICEQCGSSVIFPGIRDDGPKKVQNNGKNSKNDNKEEIEILDTNVKKQEKYCRICGKKLDKKGICKECESSSFMPGVDKNDIYKFCENCGHELLENSDFCVECGCKIKKTNTKENSGSGLGFSIAGFIVSLSSIFFLHKLRNVLLHKSVDLAALGDAITGLSLKIMCIIITVLGFVFCLLGLSKKNKQIGITLSGIGIIICILAFLLCNNIIPLRIIPI